MKTSEVFKFQAGSNEIKIESFPDGSMWGALGNYGLNRSGFITAEYINGVLRFSVIKNRLGHNTIMNEQIISDFKEFVKQKFKEINPEWHKLHNALYKI